MQEYHLLILFFRMTVLHGKHTFRGTLTLVSGDNLGSNFIGGYKQLSSALRKCRFCMAVAGDMRENVILIRICLHSTYSMFLISSFLQKTFNRGPGKHIHYTVKTSEAPSTITLLQHMAFTTTQSLIHLVSTM